MDTKDHCQSCGMPLGEGLYGTNADGSPNHDYCKYCYRNGEFTEPELSREDVIAKSIKYMMTEKHLDYNEASRQTSEYISSLRRWQK